MIELKPQSFESYKLLELGIELRTSKNNLENTPTAKPNIRKFVNLRMRHPNIRALASMKLEPVNLDIC